MNGEDEKNLQGFKIYFTSIQKRKRMKREIRERWTFSEFSVLPDNLLQSKK